MYDFVQVTRCKYCKHKNNCSITRGDDWYCPNGEPILNTTEKPLIERLHEMLTKNPSDYYQETMYIPEACRACSNHPSNGGSGICNCILGSETIW